MTVTTDYRDAYDMIRAAKRDLILARMYRQEAEVALEFDILYGEAYEGDTQAKDLFALAREFRSSARELLKSIEVENGFLYLIGKAPTPLSRFLMGKNFRLWTCYKPVYKGSILFEGKDPA